MAPSENDIVSLQLKFEKAIVCIRNIDHFKYMITFACVRNKCTKICHSYCEQITEKIFIGAVIHCYFLLR